MAAYRRVKLTTTCVVLVLFLQMHHAFEIREKDNVRLEGDIRGGNTDKDIISRVRRGVLPPNELPLQQRQIDGGAGRGVGVGVDRLPYDARARIAGDSNLQAQDRRRIGEGLGQDQGEGVWARAGARQLHPQQQMQGDGAPPVRNWAPNGNAEADFGGGPPARAPGPAVGNIRQNQAHNMPQNNQMNQGPAAAAPQRKPGRPVANRPIRIAENAACANDVKRHCANKGNNFAVLDCLQQADKDITMECNHFLWNYKMNLTKDYRFDNAAGEVCREDMRKFPDCSALEPGKGLILPCLLDHSENITATQCLQYINRMKEITFGDYRLINGFYSACADNIEGFNCGTVNEKGDNQLQLPHSQGGTIHCLEKHIRELEKSCRLQILRVAELSSNDYHQDRHVFYACREDRERLCPKVVSGQGRIYKCLKEHKFDPSMSTDCKESLTTRQQVAAQDVKVNFRLYRKCRAEIERAECTFGQVNTKEMKMATILLCLEKAEKEGTLKISGDCRAELTDTRKEIMSDYMISPELMEGCRKEIEKDCHGIRREGKTIHCLMGLGKRNKLSNECKVALSNLVEEADAGSDYKLDPSLHKACKEVKDQLCAKQTDAEALTCLMENIDSRDMSEDCAKRLLEIQYFISRNFRLDPVLYKNCETDAKNHCYQDMHSHNKDVPTGIIFACLHTHLHDESSPLQPRCADQVHRVLRQRAVSVHLNPRIEQECRMDLGKLCADKTQRGEELRCLQDHMGDLAEKCRLSVANFTVEEAEDIKMNRKLIASCAPMLKKFCQEKLKAKKVDEGEALQCLIENKNDDEMEPKCQASIEHFQLIQLKDYRFSFKFKESCRKNVLTFCKGSRDKSSIVKCLSSKVREAVLGDKVSPLDPECRAQLKFELLQRDENIDLDPELKRACSDEIVRLCPKVTAGNARMMECLRSHQEELANLCHIKIFNREKEMVAKPDIDYALMHGCKKTIKLKCKDAAPDKLIECLKAHKDDPDTEPRCKVVLTKRQIERNSNIKLNPLLQKACKMDIPKFCGTSVEPGDDVPDMEGKVIQCLRQEFQKKVSKLTSTCSKHIAGVLKEGAEDFRLDRMMVKHCMVFIKQECAEEMENPGSGRVEECLKTKISKIKDKDCLQQVIGLFREGLADVHVDPLLYKACALDIKHYCQGIPQGQGQQMSCLLEALEQKAVTLQPDCQRMLSERKEMWEYAAQVAPVQGIFDIYLQMANSPSRNYFLLIFMSFVGVLFFFGLCCGRATKRVRHEMKSR